jgi:hypothetical protein
MYGLFQDTILNILKLSNWFIYRLENDNFATAKIMQHSFMSVVEVNCERWKDGIE